MGGGRWLGTPPSAECAGAALASGLSRSVVAQAAPPHPGHQSPHIIPLFLPMIASCDNLVYLLVCSFGEFWCDSKWCQFGEEVGMGMGL